MPDVGSLIGYIVDQVNDRGGFLGRTALVKLVYLVDLEHCRRYGRPVTNLKWRFHHYGPYATELAQAANHLSLDIDEQEFVESIDNRRVSGYRRSTTGDWREIRREFNSQFGASERRAVDKVIEQWALEPLPTILDYVYFETEPMQGARRGEYLDFSKVQQEPAIPGSGATLNLPVETIANLRARLKHRQEKPGGKVRKATEPVYDQVYIEACKVMEEEEGTDPNIKPHTKLLGPNRE